VKHTTIRIAGLLLAWAALSMIAVAQDVSVTASASPNVLRTGEQFNLTYTANQEITGVELPQIDGAALLGGPSQGRFQSVSSVNGKVTTNSTFQFTYFLQANREGKLNIPPATVRVKGKAYKTNALTVEVLAAKSQPAKGSGNTDANVPQAAISGEGNVMVSLLTDKKEVYLGEQITATVKIYTKVTLAGVDLNFKGPDFTGFFTEPLEVPQLRNLQREALNGEIYYSGVLRKMVVIPQKTGQLTIKPFDLDVAVRQEVRRRSVDPFFEDFDFPDVQEVPLKLKSKPVTIRVNPLPAGAPESFTGGVGSFTFQASLNKNTAVAQEPLTLKLTVTGRGNIKLINEPRIDLPSDFEKYDPVINTSQENGAGGTKTFEYMLVPKVAGDFTIPAVEFSYFDPDARQYKTLRSESYTVKVAHGSGDTLMTMAPGMAQEDIRLLNRDIRYIKTKSLNLRAKQVFWADSPWYYLLYGAFAVLFAALLIVVRKRARERADTAGLRLRQADRYARKRLVKSEALLKQGDSNRFYEEILGALWGYLSDKLNIPLSVLSRETAQSALNARGVDDDLTGELFRIVGECEMARYGQVSGNLAMEKLYRETLDVISKIQQKLR
jgi:hypothetical protein